MNAQCASIILNSIYSIIYINIYSIHYPIVSPAHLQDLLYRNYPHTHIEFGTGFTPDVLPDATQH